MARDYRLPPEWEAAGARVGRDGLLYLAEWRRGFTVHELRALFFDCLCPIHERSGLWCYRWQASSSLHLCSCPTV